MWQIKYISYKVIQNLLIRPLQFFQSEEIEDYFPLNRHCCHFWGINSCLRVTRRLVRIPQDIHVIPFKCLFVYNFQFHLRIVYQQFSLFLETRCFIDLQNGNSDRRIERRAMASIFGCVIQQEFLNQHVQ